MKKKPIEVVLYHRDMDGCLSALTYAVSNRRRERQYGFGFRSIQYKEDLPLIQEKILNWVEKGVTRVTFLDFGPDPQAVEVLLSNNIHVAVYDHHEGRRDAYRQIFDKQAMESQEYLTNIIGNLPPSGFRGQFGFIDTAGVAICKYLADNTKFRENSTPVEIEMGDGATYVSETTYEIFPLSVSYRNICDLMGRRDVGEAWDGSVPGSERFMMKFVHGILMETTSFQKMLDKEQRRLRQKDMLEIFNWLNTLDVEKLCDTKIPLYAKSIEKMLEVARSGKPTYAKGGVFDMFDATFIDLDGSDFYSIPYASVSELGHLANEDRPCIIHVGGGKYSVRSRNEHGVCARTICEKFGGGGHRNAAGFNLEVER